MTSAADRPVACAHCGARRRDVSLWAQIVDLGHHVVCCDGSLRA